MGGSADLSTALIEAATPETFSPRQVVCYQLANERILQAALEANRPVDQWSLIKSNSDAFGHTLGQHESYDMRIASGPWLIAWWLGLAFLFLPLVIYRMFALVWLGCMLGLAIVLSALRGTSWKPESTPSGIEDLANSEQLLGFPMKPWQWMLAASGLRRLHSPIVWIFGWLLIGVALRPHRKKATAFLACRSILDGSGHLDSESRFWISSRASNVDRVIGFGSYDRKRPIFRCDPLLRKLLSEPYWSFAQYAQLFQPIQRIEIAIGDSGLCQQSQWLRIGATALVLDWVEQTDDPNVIQLRSVPEATREFARDWMLVRSVPDRMGNEFRAREISRVYLRSLKSWLDKRPDAPSEAWEILELWQMTLNQIDTIPKNQGQPPMLLVGRIDWISKLWLIQQLDKNTDWSIKKKIDIRYHELSDQGYHAQLIDVLQLPPLLSDREIEKAKRVPPSNSPAWRRGNLIRELSDSPTDLVIDWESARYRLDQKNYRLRFPR
ncbi:MAG: proteasome accessory factor PafA2 family protein [Pirellula sp.]